MSVVTSKKRNLGRGDRGHEEPALRITKRDLLRAELGDVNDRAQTMHALKIGEIYGEKDAIYFLPPELLGFKRVKENVIKMEDVGSDELLSIECVEEGFKKIDDINIELLRGYLELDQKLQEAFNLRSIIGYETSPPFDAYFKVCKELKKLLDRVPHQAKNMVRGVIEDVLLYEKPRGQTDNLCNEIFIHTIGLEMVRFIEEPNIVRIKIQKTGWLFNISIEDMNEQFVEEWIKYLMHRTPDIFPSLFIPLKPNISTFSEYEYEELSKMYGRSPKNAQPLGLYKHWLDMISVKEDVFNKEALAKRAITHEFIHSQSPIKSLGGEYLGSFWFYEGATETLNVELLCALDVPLCGVYYGKGVAEVAYMVMNIVGKDNFQKAYFEGDITYIENEFDKKYGFGTFKTFRILMEESNEEFKEERSAYNARNYLFKIMSEERDGTFYLQLHNEAVKKGLALQ